MAEQLMQIVAIALLMLVGFAVIASAINPTLPILRSVYWWRIPFKGRPTIVERVSVAVGGLLWIVFGGVIFIYLHFVH